MEFKSEDKHKYRFHLMNEGNEMVVRWDTAPHHPEPFWESKSDIRVLTKFEEDLNSSPDREILDKGLENVEEGEIRVVSDDKIVFIVKKMEIAKDKRIAEESININLSSEVLA